VSKTLARTLIALAGLGAAAYLLAAHGIDQVFRALQLAGLTGLAALTLMHGVSTLLCALAWWLLLRATTAATSLPTDTPPLLHPAMILM